jgi:hypothetical protein
MRAGSGAFPEVMSIVVKQAAIPLLQNNFG